MFACLKLIWSLLLFFAEIYSPMPYFPFPLPLFPLYTIFFMIINKIVIYFKFL